EDSPGRALIHELARRRLLGSYFGFQGYAKLRKVTTTNQLREFLNAEGHRGAPVEEDAASIADYLAATQIANNRTAYTTWAIVDSIFWILGILGLLSTL